MNLIGKCIIAGNVRRTAEIAFGSADSEEYCSLKDYTVNPHRQQFGWTSNNSVFAEIGIDYSKVAEKIQGNGEPGIAWLENMKVLTSYSCYFLFVDGRLTMEFPIFYL
jgi:ribonucleoside-triphosphate reductase (thioredoxin)